MLKKELEAIIKTQDKEAKKQEGIIIKLDGEVSALKDVIRNERGAMLIEDDNSDSVIKSLKDQMRDIQMEKETTVAWRNVWLALLIVSVVLHILI